MPDDKQPEDVAALLSHSKLSHYKVFSEQRRSGNHDSGSAHPEPPSDLSDGSKLEFVRPQPPKWVLLQELAAGGESPASHGETQELRVPTFAVCSTGGGAGKTTVSATLGRALSLTGDNILMIHGMQQASAPLHFGAQFSQAGRLRTFVPPQREQGTVHILAHQFDEELQQEEESGEWLIREVGSMQSEIDRCIIEITSPRSKEAQIINLARICLIVLTPDMNSVLALAPFRNLAERANRPGVRAQSGVYFILNKFDPASAFHAEVRQSLRTQLGSRLLPFCIRRSDSISEALAAGMTVLDYAPGSAPSDDFMRLANWAREVTTSKRAQGAV